MKTHATNARVLSTYSRARAKLYENPLAKCSTLHVIKLCIALMNRLNKNYNADYNTLDTLYQMCLYMYIFLGHMFLEMFLLYYLLVEFCTMVTL